MFYDSHSLVSQYESDVSDGLRTRQDILRRLNALQRSKVSRLNKDLDIAYQDVLNMLQSADDMCQKLISEANGLADV